MSTVVAMPLAGPAGAGLGGT